MAALVLLRHGESAWNAADVFTGWIDVRLSDRGKQQAHEAGQLLATRRTLPDVVHTSVIKHLEAVSDDAVSALEVPNATPLGYQFPAGQPGRASDP